MKFFSRDLRDERGDGPFITDHGEFTADDHITMASTDRTRWDDGGARGEVRERVARVAGHLGKW